MNAGEMVIAPARIILPPIDEDNLALWQGRIAVAAAKGDGSDVFKAALKALKLNMRSDDPFYKIAEDGIWETAERHLPDFHDWDELNAIYVDALSEEVKDHDLPTANCELDSEVLKLDGYNSVNAEITRLSELKPVEYDRQREASAKSLGIRMTTLDGLVKKVCCEASNTPGQGRPLELSVIEPWPESIDGGELLGNICSAFRKYLVLPPGSAETLALWVVHTHTFQCFAHSPRLAITSPEKGCGKTTTLDILGELVAQPLPTSNATTAAIFRTVEKAAPTLLIDEADTFLKDNEELRGILNAGHRRGGQIIRTVGEDHEPRQFSTWAPAAIAMIGRLPDTLEDRSVSISLRRKKPAERVHQFRSDRCSDLKVIARKIARWAEDNREALAAADPYTGKLVNRAADNWRPLLAIADEVGEEWTKRARTVAEATESIKEDQSIRSVLLADIREFFAARPETDRVRSSELAAALGAMENRRWSDWRNGKSITAAALARLLGPFGILPGSKRDGDATFKGYLLSDFRDAFESYLSAETVTPSQGPSLLGCDTSEIVTSHSSVTPSKASQNLSLLACDGVTVPAAVREEEQTWEF